MCLYSHVHFTYQVQHSSSVDGFGVTALLTSIKYTVYHSLQKMGMFRNIPQYESNLFRLNKIMRLKTMTSNCFARHTSRLQAPLSWPYQVQKRMICPTGTLLFQSNKVLVSGSRGCEIKKICKAVIFLCFEKRKPCYCVTVMDLDYLEVFYLSILAKVKVFGNWESNNFLAGCFKIKCQLSETIQGVKTVQRNLGISLLSRGQLGSQCPQHLSHQIHYLLQAFISAYIIQICSARQAQQRVLSSILVIYPSVIMRKFCCFPCTGIIWIFHMDFY